MLTHQPNRLDETFKRADDGGLGDDNDDTGREELPRAVATVCSRFALLSPTITPVN